MADISETAPDSKLTIERALVELSSSHSLRPKEIGPNDLPETFEFAPAALEYGHAQAERGVQIYRELGIPTETRFTFKIDFAAQQFVLAEPATAPQGTQKRVIKGADGHERIQYKPDHGTTRDLIREGGRMLFSLAQGFRAGGLKTRFAHVLAIRAHTHPPLHPVAFPKNSDVATERLLGLFQISIPSTEDIAAITVKGDTTPQMIFAPCGLTILMVPTDMTPRLNNDERERLRGTLDRITMERSHLQTDFLRSIAGGEISQGLEAVLRDMYSHDGTLAGASAKELLARSMRYVVSGDAHATLFNPLTFWDMQQLTRALEDLHAVGYHNLFSTGNTFVRFTANTPSSSSI